MIDVVDEAVSPSRSPPRQAAVIARQRVVIRVDERTPSEDAVSLAGARAAGDLVRFSKRYCLFLLFILFCLFVFDSIVDVE